MFSKMFVKVTTSKSRSLVILMNWFAGYCSALCSWKKTYSVMRSWKWTATGGRDMNPWSGPSSLQLLINGPPAGLSVSLTCSRLANISCNENFKGPGIYENEKPHIVLKIFAKIWHRRHQNLPSDAILSHLIQVHNVRACFSNANCPWRWLSSGM